MSRNIRMWLGLSWLWVAIVAAYSIWCAVNYAGMFRWAANLEIDRLGSYSEKWTAILPGTILAAPALWFIGRRSRLARAAAEASPRSETDRLRRARLFFAIIGVLAFSVGGTSFLLSQSIPNGVERAVPFDASRLGMVPAPKGRVLIRGEAVPRLAATLGADGPFADDTLYTGFRPDGAAARGQPVRLFIERGFGAGRGTAADQFFLDEQDGYLVENGLPGAIVEKLRRRGIEIPVPNYVLRTQPSVTRDPYYAVAGVGAFFGLMFLTFAAAVTVRARRLQT